MIFYGYMDDSADRLREKVIVSAAIMGQKDKWSALRTAWKTRLDQDGIEYFKSSHCETLNGQFHRFRELGVEEGKKRAIQVKDDLYAIVRACGVVGVGVTLSVPTHSKMLTHPDEFGVIPEVPYQLAFQQAIAECGKTMKLMGRGNIVTFAHDEGNDYPALHSLYKEFKKQNPKYAGVLGGFVPLDDKTHPEMQAADVVAYTTLDRAKSYEEGKSPEKLKALRHSIYKLVVWLDDPVPYGDMSKPEAPAIARYVVDANT